MRNTENWKVDNFVKINWRNDHTFIDKEICKENRTIKSHSIIKWWFIWQKGVVKDMSRLISNEWIVIPLQKWGGEGDL